MIFPGLFMVKYKSFKKSPVTTDPNKRDIKINTPAKIKYHNLSWWTSRLLLFGSFGLGVLGSRRLFRNRRY